MPKLYFKIFVFILAITLPSNINSAEYGKIKGGRAAKAGEFPFIGHITFQNEGIKVNVCGCSLVTTSKVVTAGHCVMKWVNGHREMLNIKTGMVYFGTLYLMSDDGQQSAVESVKYPKEIRKKKLGGVMHDYATATLVTPLKITDTVQLMKVYSTDKTEFKHGWDEMVASEAPCVIIGWGATDFKIINKTTLVSSGVNKFLKTTVVHTWDEERCARFAGPPQDNMLEFGEICLLGVTHGETSLPGDSGGPLMCGDYVWAVCSSMFVDASGTKPFHYLLHWHYLNEYLYPMGSSGSTIRPEISIPLFFITLFLR
ncbi:granzyme H-like [Cimex lectularius]|uniref:Peptidase S1 domain-containing protein n=1 Tax=Cimex lectularius TaxID=79782 RepID=A0A8I6RF65_CIMLE|nr:granzyme H-like [Cimex lectularius]